MSKSLARLKSGKKAASKIVHGDLRTMVPAGMASAGPPLGSMLGQRNINVPAFCKTFNDKTSNIKPGVPLPVKAKVHADRSYDLIIHKPPTSYFLKHAAGIPKAAMGCNEIAGKVTLKHVYEIAKIKSEDPPLLGSSMEHICNMIIGQARTMGIEVVRDLDPQEYAQFLEERKTVVEGHKQKLQELREAKMLRTVE